MGGHPFSLAGKNALVVGGTRGIGQAIAEALADAGARVVIAGRSERSVKDVTAQLRGAGHKADSVVLDVTNERTVAAAVQSYSGDAVLDVLVNAAGVSPIFKRAETIQAEEWDEIIATNLTGMFRTCVAFGRGMLDRRSGAIVNIVSVAAVVGLPRLAAYTASKAGALGLTRTLALEWADRGVRVNAIAPSFIHTDMTAGLESHDRYGPQIVENTPLGRFGDPQDVAGAAVFLASDAARFVTGTTLFVDGGWTAR